MALASDEIASKGLQSSGAFDRLCALTAAVLSPELADEIAEWNWSGFGWDQFLDLAERHGILPMAARILLEHASGIPTEIELRLRSAYESNLQRSLWFAAELARIARHFDCRQLRVIPYKGPVLAQSLYGDLGMRSFSDLDFLISPTDFEASKQALAEIGYRPSAAFTAAVERMNLRIGYERSFDGAAGRHLVELQWALLPYFYAVGLRAGFRENNSRYNDSRDNDYYSGEFAADDLGVENLLARSSSMVIGGDEVLCLSPEDSLLVLCVHAAKHLWSRLIWIVDIAQTVRTQTIDYALVSRRANALGIARIAGVSLWLAEKVLQVSLPAGAEAMIVSDPQVELLGTKFAERLARGQEYELESTEYFKLIFQLRERRSDRWRYISRLVWTPSSGDVAAVRLPEKLFPLYRIVRLGRLARKII